MTRSHLIIKKDYLPGAITLSVPLALLIAYISIVGIFSPDFYSSETPNWQIQSLGQDIIDLVFILPVLLVTAVLASRIRKIGALLWGGVLVYLIYTFIIYCFDVHFNQLFIFY